MSSNLGRKAINPRVVFGALILKHKKNSTEEEILEEIIKTLTYWVTQEIYRQQREMYANRVNRIDDRIVVSLSQQFIRPIVRGKSDSLVEFGAKIWVSIIDGGGYNYLDKVSFDSYNEGSDLIENVESFRSKHGHYPEFVSADKIYGSKMNREFMKSKGIKFTGSKLGRPSKLKAAIRPLDKKNFKSKGKAKSSY